MNKHNYNSENISEDDFRVLGQPEKKRFNKKKVIIALLTFIALLFCVAIIMLSLQKPTVKPVSEQLDEFLDKQSDDLKLSYAEKLDIKIDDTIDVLNLTLYVPRNAIPSVTIGSPNTTLTEEAVLAFRAANLHPDSSLVDCFVCNGVVFQPDTISPPVHKGFCAIIDNVITIGTAERTPLFEQAAETNGSFFRQHSLVADGKVTANMEGEAYKTKTFRRALCQRGNHIFVVTCDDISMHRLAQVLADLGVDNAIYLIGGHNPKTFDGWWRDKNDDIELFRKKEEFIKYPLENYIVWRKAGVDK
jgi:hypothetical protein